MQLAKNFLCLSFESVLTPGVLKTSNHFHANTKVRQKAGRTARFSQAGLNIFYRLMIPKGKKIELMVNTCSPYPHIEGLEIETVELVFPSKYYIRVVANGPGNN